MLFLGMRHCVHVCMLTIFESLLEIISNLFLETFFWLVEHIILALTMYTVVR